MLKAIRLTVPEDHEAEFRRQATAACDAWIEKEFGPDAEFTRWGELGEGDVIVLTRAADGPPIHVGNGPPSRLTVGRRSDSMFERDETVLDLTNEWGRKTSLRAPYEYEVVLLHA